MEERVYDFWIEAEPAKLGNRFASETENEFTVEITLKRKSCVHKVEVLGILLLCIRECLPDGHCVRMQMDVSLSLECRKPKKGIALVVDAGIAANHFVLIGDDDVSGIATCTQFLKECFVRNKTAKFQPIIIFEQLVITMDVFG